MKSDHRSKFPTFKQLEGRSLKNIRASTGFELVASAMTRAMLDQLSCEARHLERGQFVEFISSRAVKWCEMCMKYKYAVQICISYTFHTVIPKNEGLQPLKYFFNQRPIKKPSLETVTRSSWAGSHTQLFFIWWQLLQKQINGVAMGTKMGPSYANLFVSYIENKFFSNYQGPKADLYKRYLYIDDCVGATSSSREELNLFITSVNSFHPG